MQEKTGTGGKSSVAHHPYIEYENTRLWRVTRKALADLEENRDLMINTGHEYVVGYVCKQLATKGLVRPEGLRRPAPKTRHAVKKPLKARPDRA